MMAKTKAGSQTSTQPGTPNPAGEKASKKRQPHPALKSKDEAVYPLPGLPDDFDFAKHAQLKKRDFQSDYMYFEYKTAELEIKVEAMQAKAEEAKKLGSSKERAKARRLLRLQATMKELTASLVEAGVDVDELLATQEDEE